MYIVALRMFILTRSKAPALAHHTMTSERIPLLGGAVPAYETFFEHWKAMSQSSTNPQFGPILEEALTHADQYHQLMRANDAYLLAMCA